MAALGVGAAALAVPAGAVAARGSGPGHLEALRDWYQREIETLAEELRPRFEAGELRANSGDDYEDGTPRAGVRGHSEGQARGGRL